VRRAVMKKHSWVFPTLLIVVFGLAFVGGLRAMRPTPMAIKFASSASAAFDQAKKEGKAVMIDFNADWCAPCQVMKKEAFTDASVAALLEDVVPVGINVDRPGADSEWLDREGRLALPTVVFYRADGTEIGRTIGYGGVEQFKDEVETILSKE